MISPEAILESVDLRSADAVVDALTRGARANRTCRWRSGCCEVVDLSTAPERRRLLLTGDLHDNPLHLMRLARACSDPAGGLHHLTLHELIHGDRLTNGLDYSYRVLTRAAALKAAHPDTIHTLLANHELSQIVGSGVVKDGIRCVDAFNEAIDAVFGGEGQARGVHAAVAEFIRSMPLAVRFVRPGLPDILSAHSLPAPELMERFDPSVLHRELTDEDLIPRRGSAHLMVWGRGQTPDQLLQLAKAWEVGIFVLGHEKADDGMLIIPPNAVVLNSDHPRGVYLNVPVGLPPTLADLVATATRLA